jgi:hypothetical protein
MFSIRDNLLLDSFSTSIVHVEDRWVNGAVLALDMCRGQWNYGRLLLDRASLSAARLVLEQGVGDFQVSATVRVLEGVRPPLVMASIGVRTLDYVLRNKKTLYGLTTRSTLFNPYIVLDEDEMTKLRTVVTAAHDAIDKYPGDHDEARKHYDGLMALAAL